MQPLVDTNPSHEQRFHRSSQTASAFRTGEMACRAPFDLSHSLAFLRGFSPMHGEQEIRRNLLSKAMNLEGQPVVLRLFQPRSESKSAAPRLRYALGSDRAIDPQTEAAAVDRIASFLSTDEDLQPFYGLAERDVAFVPIVGRLRGLHHVKFPSPFEAACWGVLNQRIGMPAARKMKDALVRELGARMTQDDVAYWAFPEAATVAGFGEGALCLLLGNDRKARALHAVARAFADAGDTFLRHAGHDELKTWLEGIYGVGVFTASFVLYRGFGRFERGPMSPEFTVAAKKVYGRDLSESDVRDLLARYGRWAGHWMLYVWASTFVPASAGTIG